MLRATNDMVISPKEEAGGERKEEGKGRLLILTGDKQNERSAEVKYQ